MPPDTETKSYSRADLAKGVSLSLGKSYQLTAAKAEGFLLQVNDSEGNPLRGASVSVLQDGKEIFSGTLGDDGSVQVTGNDPSRPCEVLVDGHGLLGVEGAAPVDEPDSGEIPDYDPGPAVAVAEGCGCDYGDTANV